mmetsp:Transcript_105320/g.304664  ORF Transcript_105320/g.304664 Transcript_105320/m.304664 type:complete len:209 (-) Transcript_105320:749-1375(-)
MYIHFVVNSSSTEHSGWKKSKLKLRRAAMFAIILKIGGHWKSSCATCVKEFMTPIIMTSIFLSSPKSTFVASTFLVCFPCLFLTLSCLCAKSFCNGTRNVTRRGGWQDERNVCTSSSVLTSPRRLPLTVCSRQPDCTFPKNGESFITPATCTTCRSSTRKTKPRSRSFVKARLLPTSPQFSITLLRANRCTLMKLSDVVQSFNVRKCD